MGVNLDLISFACLSKKDHRKITNLWREENSYYIWNAGNNRFDDRMRQCYSSDCKNTSDKEFRWFEHHVSFDINVRTCIASVLFPLRQGFCFYLWQLSINIINWNHDRFMVQIQNKKRMKNMLFAHKKYKVLLIRNILNK